MSIQDEVLYKALYKSQADNVKLRAERDRMWPVWKQRFVIRRKLGYLLRDYPDDKETAALIAIIDGANNVLEEP